ncbi:MAG TPA: choline dehydrogenase, partial [Rhodobacteraceae bacterium]|nr:choline dehydrogenase [Paracoccaceae bacterium]
GINVIADSPEVGENLQDHYQMRQIVQMTNKWSLNNDVRNPIKLAKMGIDWALSGTGPLTVGAGQVGGGASTSLADPGRPDIQFNVMPLSVDKPGTPLHKFSGFTASFWQCHPESRGTVNIGSADPMADPIIKPNYLSTERDRSTMIEGVKMLRDIINQPSFKHLWNNEIVPGPSYISDNEILSAVRNMGSTVFHPVGTCRMGSDANAVLDSELKVNGVKNLRVIDASAMPKITSANTNAPTYLIGEKGADMILNGNRKNARHFEELIT